MPEMHAHGLVSLVNCQSDLQGAAREPRRAEEEGRVSPVGPGPRWCHRRVTGGRTCGEMVVSHRPDVTSQEG